jgi:hypothetical protein
VQDVLQADWQEDWHLPQPPVLTVDLIDFVVMVLMCFKSFTSRLDIIYVY